jgi:hypothetical protein
MIFINSSISYISFICRYSTYETLLKIIVIRKSTEGSLEKQMFHNRRTLQQITEIREEDIKDNVMALYVLKIM